MMKTELKAGYSLNS